jgi:hypothetical protein
MDLNSIIPDRNNRDYSASKNFLMYRKYQKIPLCFIEDDIVYVFLDKRISKVVIKLVKNLCKNKIEFYFTIPDLSNPKGVADYEDKVVEHYLRSYAQEEFFYGFQKIGFDFIKNFVDWANKNNCYDLIKPNYDYILKKVNRKYYDYWSNRDTWVYSKDIRDDFNTLYREIQINNLI